ncbi:MAG: hypothetical protein HY741_14300 [Chloroflexi bacterium]|nr:hypothetical protein [Chloroflexota bacterium]
MKQKRILVFALLVFAALAFSGCGLFGGGGEGGGATATPPLPTAVVVATNAPGEPTAAPQPATAAFIGGNVFNDSNGNGAKEDGEPIIAGIIVTLANGACPGAVVGQTTSTVNTPAYKFDSLNAGEYCVAIDAASPQNSAILGQGEWTAPQKAQGIIADTVNLRQRPKDNVDFGWTFATIGQITPPPEQPTPGAGEPTAIPVIPTPTAFVAPTAAPPTVAPQACTFKATWLEDVTVPDGQVMLPNTPFIKTWRVQNTGSCSWGPGSGLSSLQFIGGNTLGAPNLVPIPNAIPAGATADLSIQMAAPAQPGTYKSNWKLRVDDGTLIGVGPHNAALYASIRVQAIAPPTAVPPPTSISPTTVPPPGPAQPITFAPGATEAEAQGQLAANGIATYSINAQAGQMMELTLSSNSASARIAVLAPTGAPLAPQRGNPEGTYWQNTVPVSGDYLIQVLAGNAAPVANFGLNVTIPVRITFASGAISAQVQGTTSNSQSGATSFNGQLPMTQDYVIQVVPFGNGNVTYTLDVTVQ